MKLTLNEAVTKVELSGIRQFTYMVGHPRRLRPDTGRA